MLLPLVGLIDVNPELQGIVYQSNNTFVYEMRKYDGRHSYVYHIAIRRATHGSDSPNGIRIFLYYRSFHIALYCYIF